MSDTFGDFWDDDADSAAATIDEPMLPDGRHVGTITWAGVKELSFKTSDRNPTGKSLVVTLRVNGYQPVEDIVPVQMRGVIGSICRSAGIDPPAKGDSFQAFSDRLKGQTAPIESALTIAKSGKEYIRITWLKGVEVLPAHMKVEKRTKPKAKPEPVDEAPDDIPF